MPLPQIYTPKCAADCRPETRAIFQAIKASDVKAVQALVEAGEDLSITSHFKYTPLHYACWLYAEKAGPAGISMPKDLGLIIQVLVEGGASLTARDSLGNMPNALCFGHGPRCLRGAMEDETRSGTWPEPNPRGMDYEEDDARPTAPSRPANFVPKGWRAWKPKHREAA